MSASFFETLLVPDKERPREEPEVAANIGIQLQHMGMAHWSVSVIRRLRDAIGRLNPKTILEFGGGIGYRSAWLMDLFESPDLQPESYTIVEEGSRFGIIIKRLLDRYKAESWARVVVGDPLIMLGEVKAWMAAGKPDDDPPLPLSCDCIIVDTSPEKQLSLLDSALSLLSKEGVLFTFEPPVPVGELEENDPSVIDFNAWIAWVKNIQQTHHLAFTPLHEGTLVTLMSKA